MQHSFIEKIKELIGIDITCESLDLFKQSHMTYQEALFSFMLQKWPRVESDAYTYLVAEVGISSHFLNRIGCRDNSFFEHMSWNESILCIIECATELCLTPLLDGGEFSVD